MLCLFLLSLVLDNVLPAKGHSKLILISTRTHSFLCPYNFTDRLVKLMLFFVFVFFTKYAKRHVCVTPPLVLPSSSFIPSTFEVWIHGDIILFRALIFIV